MLAVDHGYFLGPTEKLENPAKVIAPLLKYCDIVFMLGILGMNVCFLVQEITEYVVYDFSSKLLD